MDVITTFLHAETGELKIPASRERAGPKIHVTIQFLDPELAYVGRWKFCLSVTVQKLFYFFICIKNAFWKFWGRDISADENFFNETPKGTSLSQIDWDIRYQYKLRLRNT